jgi:chromosome partitioning protein
MAKITTVSIQKGGVGKSTTATNLAASWALMGDRVLFIDLDPQSDATRRLGIEPRTEGLRTIVDLFADGNVPVTDAIIRRELNNKGAWIDIIPSHPDFREVARSLNERQTGMVKSILTEILGEYDHIVIDTPPGDSLIAVNAYIASDRVLIPVQVEPSAVAGLQEVMAALAQVQRGLNPGLTIAGILPTMVKRNTALSNASLNNIKEAYPELFIADWIPETNRFGETELEGLPLVVLEHEKWRKSDGTKAYNKLAERLRK